MTLEMPIAAMAMARVVVVTFIVFCFGAWICETRFCQFLDLGCGEDWG